MGRHRIHSLIFALSLAVSPFAPAQNQAQSGDFHTREDQARRLYAISAFAHGHRHGYEEGFRAADIEIHVGRLQRELREKDVPKAEYKKEYGDKKHFQWGFIRGFMAGYDDSFAGRSFRLVEWSAEVPPFDWMTELPQADEVRATDSKLKANFEDGMVQGYQTGTNTPVLEVDAKGLAAQAERRCGEEGVGRKEGYCNGFTQGFLLGVNYQSSSPPLKAGVSAAMAQRDQAQPGQPH